MILLAALELPFARPWLLLALIAPALLLMWTWRRSTGQLVLPVDGAATPRGRGWRVLLDGAESLLPLVLAVAVLIAAGPQRWSEPRTQRALTNIQFCLDVSGSMTAEFGEGSRYDAAMHAINQFLVYRDKGDAFGLSVFGNDVLHWVPLTTDVSAFRCAPPFLRPENLPHWFGGTSIGLALRACRKVLIEREEGDRMIVLVSDGWSSDLGGGASEQIAKELADDGIQVFYVHVGEESAPDETALIPERTGGATFATGDPEMLPAIFERIDAMKRTSQVTIDGEAVDWFEPVCAAGLLLLALHALASFGLRYTPW